MPECYLCKQRFEFTAGIFVYFDMVEKQETWLGLVHGVGAIAG